MIHLANLFLLNKKMISLPTGGSKLGEALGETEGEAEGEILGLREGLADGE